jgi:hypothetical protein
MRRIAVRTPTDAGGTPLAALTVPAMSRPIFTTLHGNVIITGVGFWDIRTDRPAWAPNGIEFHPCCPSMEPARDDLALRLSSSVPSDSTLGAELLDIGATVEGARCARARSSRRS